MSDEPVVCVEEVVKDFRPGFGLRRKRVLHGISFRVHRGEIFGFVGPNGAGKTTTLKVLMGLIRATRGRSRILGHDVSETEFRRHVGFLPENPYFYDYLSGRETLDFYARLCGVPRVERQRRVTTLLDKLNALPLDDVTKSADATLRAADDTLVELRRTVEELRRMQAEGLVVGVLVRQHLGQVAGHLHELLALGRLGLERRAQIGYALDALAVAQQ